MPFPPEFYVERERRKQAFLEKYSVKLSHHRVCLSRLFGKRCRHYNLSCEPDKHGYVHWPSGCDHEEMAIKDGKPYAFIYQPYQISSEDMLKLYALANRLGLSVVIDPSLSWHYPDWTTLVMLRRLPLTEE